MKTLTITIKAVQTRFQASNNYGESKQNVVTFSTEAEAIDNELKELGALKYGMFPDISPLAMGDERRNSQVSIEGDLFNVSIVRL